MKSVIPLGHKSKISAVINNQKIRNLVDDAEGPATDGVFIVGTS